MLRRGMNRDEPRFINPGERCLRLEIEMLLTADLQLAFEPDRTRLDARGVAIGDSQRLVEEAARLDRLFDRQNGRQRLEVR